MEQELEQIEQVYTLITEFLVAYSFQLVGAVIVLIIGILIANKVAKFILALCKNKDIDVTLSTFLANIIKIIIVVMVAIIALGKLGISVTPFIAAVGAISLGAGLAIQGLLSNYAAGMTIIITRPFVVGNTIKIHGINGIVKEVRLACTLLTNEDGEVITIPNKHIVGEILHNSFEYALVEGVVGISYSDDPQQATNVIADVLSSFEELATDPKPQIGIENFADSGIEIGYRYWVPTAIYHQQKFKVNLAVFNSLKANDISIPFPQREVTMLDPKKAP